MLPMYYNELTKEVMFQKDGRMVVLMKWIENPEAHENAETKDAQFEVVDPNLMMKITPIDEKKTIGIQIQHQLHNITQFIDARTLAKMLKVKPDLLRMHLWTFTKEGLLERRFNDKGIYEYRYLTQPVQAKPEEEDPKSIHTKIQHELLKDDKWASNFTLDSFCESTGLKHKDCLNSFMRIIESGLMLTTVEGGQFVYCFHGFSQAEPTLEDNIKLNMSFFNYWRSYDSLEQKFHTNKNLLRPVLNDLINKNLLKRKFFEGNAHFKVVK